MRTISVKPLQGFSEMVSEQILRVCLVGLINLSMNRSYSFVILWSRWLQIRPLKPARFHVHPFKPRGDANGRRPDRCSDIWLLQTCTDAAVGLLLCYRTSSGGCREGVGDNYSRLLN